MSLELALSQQSELRTQQIVTTHQGQYTHPPVCHIDKGDISEISGCLQKLDKADISHLGMTLGISHSKLTEMKDSPSFPRDVITVWLQREEQRSTPTWKNLISALTDLVVKHEGMASEILQTERTTAEAVHMQHPEVSEPEIKVHCGSLLFE